MGNDRKILLLGAGGHCLSVLDSLMTSCEFQTIGIVDREKLENGINNIMGIPILGGDEDLPKLFQEGFTDAFITVGSVGNTDIRRKLYLKVKEIGFHIPNIIDKTSIISDWTTLGEGIFVGKNVVINANSEIGNLAIINTSSTIEHECRIGDYVHIAPGDVVCGNVQIEHDAHIGAGSVIRQGIHIGAGTVIGCGSVVVKDLAANVKAYGNPCRAK
jgi:sugar O-acyltransferase (sialic acid O-acetyltransferase NeuD family)